MLNSLWHIYSMYMANHYVLIVTDLITFFDEICVPWRAQWYRLFLYGRFGSSMRVE